MKRFLTIVLLAVTGWALLAGDTLAQGPLLQRLEQLRRSLDAQVAPFGSRLPARNAYPDSPRTGPSGLDPSRLGPPRLGIVVQNVTVEAIRRNRLVVRSGALISSIEPGSAADQAGLPLGGVIVSFEGIRIDSPGELTELVRATRPGEIVELGYYEGPRMFRKRIQLGPPVAVQDELLGSGSSEELPPPLPVAPEPSSAPVAEPATSFARPSRVPAAAEQLASQVEVLQQEVAKLATEIERLQGRIDELEGRLSGTE